MNLNLLLLLEPYTTTGMSTFQMDKFVINDQITPYRKLRQAVIEARARLENITAMGFDLEELQIKMEQALSVSALTDSSCVFDKRLNGIKIRRQEFEINRKQQLIEQQSDEAQFFLRVIKDIVENDFGGEEELLNKFKTKEFHIEQEENFWVEKLSRGVYSDLLNYGTISKGVTEAIANLTAQQQQLIISKATTQQLTTAMLLDKTRTQTLVLID